MTAKQFGVAYIGAGAVVEQRHLPGLARTGQGIARGIFDPDLDKARRVAEKFHIPVVASSLQEAIEAEGVDIVVIASPNSFHLEGALGATAAGKHVFCEKPMALNLADSRRMCQAAAAAGVQLFVGFHHRFSAEHLCARRILAEGLIGRISAFHGVTSEPIDTIPGGIANYRFRPEQGGGLSLIDFGSHRIDQMRDLLGEVEEVYVEMASVLPSHNLDDSVVLSLKMNSGAIGSLGFHRFSRGYLSPSHLFGAEGTLSISSMIVNPFQSAPLSLYTERAPETLPQDLLDLARPEGWWGEWRPGWMNLWPPRRDTFQGQYESLFASILEGRPAEVSGEDGYKTLEIVLAAYLSHQRRRPVRLPLDPAAEISAPSFPA